MKANYSHISFVLDRSGSMASRKDVTINGFNEFIASQKNTPGEATFSLYQFDDYYEINYEFKNLQDVEDLNNNTYCPRGMTRLYDAIGKTIVTMGKQLSEMKEEDRPEKVFLVIQTDGEENASEEYKFEKISDMIKHQTDVYSWNIIFLGAQLTAVQNAQFLGMAISNTMHYSDASDQGVKAAYCSLSSNMSTARGTAMGSYCHTNFFNGSTSDNDKKDD